LAGSTVRELLAARSHPERSLHLALAAARTAADNRGQNVTVLDVRERTSLFDYFVLATGTSRRQIRSMSDEIDRLLEGDLNDRRLGIEGYDESRWIVLDYGSVVIHLFDEETRNYYRLEDLWADAKAVDWAGRKVRRPENGVE
jgi:ribosome-associated protein